MEDGLLVYGLDVFGGIFTFLNFLNGVVLLFGTGVFLTGVEVLF